MVNGLIIQISKGKTISVNTDKFGRVIISDITFSFSEPTVIDQFKSVEQEIVFLDCSFNNVNFSFGTGDVAFEGCNFSGRIKIDNGKSEESQISFNRCASVHQPMQNNESGPVINELFEMEIEGAAIGIYQTQLVSNERLSINGNYVDIGQDTVLASKFLKVNDYQFIREGDSSFIEPAPKDKRQLNIENSTLNGISIIDQMFMTTDYEAATTKHNNGKSRSA